MSIYHVDKLVEDARRKFARCVPSAEEELPLREVWDTLDRYIFSCMEQNHGLVVPHFGRFGWQVAHRFRNNCVGPYFDFLESFCRRYRVTMSRPQAAPLEVDLCRWEDFNFSKAALCFSRKLTKDHVSVGLGVLVHQIGQAIAQGKPLSLDFRAGKMVMKERGVCRFLFSAEILQMMEFSPRRCAAWAPDMAQPKAKDLSNEVLQEDSGQIGRRHPPTLRGSIWRPKSKSSAKTSPGNLRPKPSPESTEDEQPSPSQNAPTRPSTSDAAPKVVDLNTPRLVRPCTSDVVPTRPSTCDSAPKAVDSNAQRRPTRPSTSDAAPKVVDLNTPRPARPCTSDVTSPRPMLCKRGKQAFQPEPESSPRCNNMKECLDQRMAMHIKELEQRAIRALGRQNDQKFKEKQEELEQRRQRVARLREHSDFLMKQMQDKEIRKRAEAEAERESVVTASTHSTPRKPRKAGVSEHRRDLLTSNEKEDCASQLTEDLAQDQLLAGRPRPAVLLGRLKAREELRECLHSQIEARKKQRHAQERERLEMEVSMLQQESQIMELESSLQKAAKREEQESLREAWSQECKLRDVHRRIEALEEGRLPQAPLSL